MQNDINGIFILKREFAEKKRKVFILKMNLEIKI